VHPQPRELHPPKAGRIERLHDRPVSDRRWRARARASHDGFHLRDARNPARQPLCQSRQNQFAGGVLLDKAPSHQPLAERLERVQPRGLSACLQCIAIGLPVCGEVELVCFEEVARDSVRPVNGLWMAPSDEMAERRTANVCGLRRKPDGDRPLDERLLQRMQWIVPGGILLRRTKRRDSLRS